MLHEVFAVGWVPDILLDGPDGCGGSTWRR